MAQFFSVINKASGNTGFLSVPELGFVIKEHHVCKLLDFLGMLLR